MFYEPLRAASDQECYMHLRKHAHKCGAATESGAGGFAARGARCKRAAVTADPRRLPPGSGALQRQRSPNLGTTYFTLLTTTALTLNTRLERYSVYAVRLYKAVKRNAVQRALDGFRIGTFSPGPPRVLRAGVALAPLLGMPTRGLAQSARAQQPVGRCWHRRPRATAAARASRARVPAT